MGLSKRSLLQYYSFHKNKPEYYVDVRMLAIIHFLIRLQKINNVEISHWSYLDELALCLEVVVFHELWFDLSRKLQSNHKAYMTYFDKRNTTHIMNIINTKWQSTIAAFFCFEAPLTDCVRNIADIWADNLSLHSNSKGHSGQFCCWKCWRF